MYNLLILLILLAPASQSDVIVQPDEVNALQTLEQPEPDFSWLSLLEKAKTSQPELQTRNGPNWFIPMDLPQLAGDSSFQLPEPAALLLFGAGLLLLLMARKLRQTSKYLRDKSNQSRD